MTFIVSYERPLLSGFEPTLT